MLWAFKKKLTAISLSAFMLLSAGLMFGSVSAVAVNAEESQVSNADSQAYIGGSDNVNWITTGGTLTDSETYGAWLPEYNMYNCYGYALGTHSPIDPGRYSDQSCVDSNNIILPIDRLADVVYDDIVGLGYECIKVEKNTFTEPNYDQHLICLRVSEGSFVDYHFMKYQGGTWFHKPSSGWLLRYKYTPSVSRPWPMELVDSSGIVKRAENVYYNSDIYFFSYKFSHNLTCSYYNQTSHRVYCQACSYEIYEDHDLQPYGDKSQCTGCYAIFTDDGYGSVILEEDEKEIY